MLNYVLARQHGFNLICLLTFNLLLLGFSHGAALTKENSANTEKLCVLAAEGQLSEALICRFYEYALENAKEKIQAPDEFWKWLANNKTMQCGLLVGLHPDYNPDVIKHLQELRKTCGSQVERFPHLALAFSFVYGAAKGQTIRAPWLDWVSKNREVPSCCESFTYYVENKDKMLYPLDKLPWPLMLYIANNDVPISERQWVLSHNKGHTLDDLAGLHNEPEYVKGAFARKVVALEGASMALPRILSDGGVCSQLAYYASRTFKCLGVPSVRLQERYHAFEGWVAGNQTLEVKIGAAYDNRKNGYFFCPLTREKHYEYEFKLLVSSVNLSYERYLKSKIACHVFGLLPDVSKKKAMGLLDASIKTNPYVVESWLEYAQACRDDVFPIETGWTLLDRANGLISDHPELACAILNILTTSQLKSGRPIPESQYQQTSNKFREILVRLRRQKRIDLALGVFETHADYLAKTKGIPAVVDSSLGWFKLDEFIIDSQKELFKYIYNMVLESKDEASLEKLLQAEYRRRIVLTRKCGEKTYAEHYSSYAQAATAYISYFKKRGDQMKASEISLELDKLKDESVKLFDFREVITQGRTLGAVGEQVTKNIPTAPGCYVWRILYDLPGGLKVRIRVKHSAPGKAGAFHLTAWSDKDGNGVPDNQIGISPLLTADKKDQWSQWEFEPTDKTVFIGIVMKEKMSFYYHMGGELEGYYGLSDRVFYSYVFGSPPESSVQPRYINIQVEILQER
jgi:hypothetical protein